MGCWEVYDIITGVSASGGPDSFIDTEWERDELADGISEKILAAAQVLNLPNHQELKEIIFEALFYVSNAAEEEKVPFPGSDTWQNPAVVIGNFGKRRGDLSVTIRSCDEYDSYGCFRRLRNSSGTWTGEETHLYEEFLDKLGNGLHAYGDPIPYGISHHLDYGIMKHMWGQFQDSFLDNCSTSEALELLCLDGAPGLAAAVSQGVRGKDLAPALFSDFQAWVFESPDIWPRKSEGECGSPLFQTFETPSDSPPMLLTLPIELLLKISASLSISDILHVSSISKGMRRLVTQPGILSQLLREAIVTPNGTLRWMQPCSLVAGEVEKANEALRSWLVADSDGSLSPLHKPDFLFVEFVHTCFVKSHSMKNRKRIWGMIKQVETLLVESRRQKGIDLFQLEAK
ncbi:hypothetical protein DL96DRAFT_1607636 [Flagelloscypha sp. PMI_526]|nr:hypothetical protein DL96DRAFT_1607636 [Flagelloscypha sp. PMI_526]